MTKDEITAIIRATLEDILPKTACGPAYAGSALFGRDGILDSIGLLTLVVQLEEKLSAATGKPVRLVTSAAMSQTKSPFRDVDSLTSYIGELCG